MLNVHIHTIELFMICGHRFLFWLGLSKVGERWDSEEEEEPLGVKELGRSKWSRDLDEDIENSDGAEKNSNALSGLIQAYSKSEKSVHWGDKVCLAL